MLLIGVVGLVVSLTLSGTRITALPLVSAVAALLGLVGILDRRIKLELGDAGIRYERWCPEVILWSEFSGFRCVNSRSNSYLQLMPVRPAQLRERFTLSGKLNQRLAGLIGVPTFSIAITPLDITEEKLATVFAGHLTEMR